MKLKDIFTKTTNRANNQDILSCKKKVVKKLGYDDLDELLEMQVKKKW